MRYVSLVLIVLVSSILTSCNLAGDDPVRIEFVQACEGRIENQIMKPKIRTTHCECAYDKTMSGLSNEEKTLASFYLLAQVGVDVNSRDWGSKLNMQHMKKVSAAIGNAGKQCKRR